MGTEIINVQNVHGYVDSNGTVWLNAADVAVGLGFVDTERIKNVTAKCGGKTKIYHQPQSIRWKRVNKYLSEFGYDIVVNKDSFIPENMLYRLAMKAILVGLKPKLTFMMRIITIVMFTLIGHKKVD